MTVTFTARHSEPALRPAALPSLPASRGTHLLDASTCWTPAGGSAVQRLLARRRELFTGNGWRHTLLAPGVRGPGRLDCGGLRLPASGGSCFVVDHRRAVRLIEQAAPDIVEVTDAYTLGWAVLDATKRLKVPAVAFCHDNLPALMARRVGGASGTATRRGRWAEQHARSYVQRLYARYELVLAPSLDMTRKLQDWGVRQALHQPLGVDRSVFSPSAYDPAWRDQLERHLGLAPGTRLLVFAGRFSADKNLAMLADAVRLLGPRHALLAVGSGPRPPTGAGVYLLQPDPEPRRLARLMASCDAFVHAGDHETCDLAVLEAMACGTPLVTSAGDGLGELVNGVGLTLRSPRAADWAEAIAASLADPLAPLAWAGLERARNHDSERVFDLLARRYRQLIGGRSAPRHQSGSAVELVSSPA